MLALDRYLPAVGPFIVIPAWLMALRCALSDRVAGTLAVWFAIATAGILRYYGSGTGIPGVSPLTAYPLALPSYLLIAWACGRAFAQRSNVVARAVAVAACVAAATPLASQLITERYHDDLQFRGARYTAEENQCLVVKAAGAYVREQNVPGAMVFHLSDRIRLGMFGEFYYGLSYLGNNQTGERNRIVDFGSEIIGRRYTPEQLARAYGVPHFTHYIEFLAASDAFAADAVSRLQAAGARVAVEIRARGDTIGRIWRFDGTSTQVMDIEETAARWNRVGTLPRLFVQSLAGTAYHFGPAWPPVRD
jgi:hypothetical protein